MNIYQPLWDALIAAPNFPLKDFTPPATGKDRANWDAATDVWHNIRKPDEIAEHERLCGDHQYTLNKNPKIGYCAYAGQAVAMLGFLAMYCGRTHDEVHEAAMASWRLTIKKAEAHGGSYSPGQDER
jgi:hypothetical protein